MWNVKVTVIPVVVRALGTVFVIETGESEDQRTNRDHRTLVDLSTVEIS